MLPSFWVRLAGGLAARNGSEAGLFAALVMSFAIACWIAAFLIPATGEGAPGLKIATNVVTSTTAMIRYLRADHDCGGVQW